MVSTTTKKKRNKRPDYRPNGKRRRHEIYAQQEKDRLERVAKNEEKNKPKLEKLPPLTKPNKDKNLGQVLKKPAKAPVLIRIRALHKLLRQIQVLDEKKQGGASLNDAQEAKLARMDAVMDELEELQNVEESEEEEHISD